MFTTPLLPKNIKYIQNFPNTSPLKLSIPKLNFDLLDRQRLYCLLDQSLNYQITIVCAGAGYGKTTLVASWVSQKRIPKVWVSLDKNDQDLLTFLSYIIRSFEDHFPGIWERYENLFADIETQQISWIIEDFANLLNSQGKEILIILDDFHLINSEKILKAVENFVNHLSDKVHLVIITRKFLSINLSRWRISNKLLEIGREDLRCKDDEAYEYLCNVLHQDLSYRDIIRLNKVTEGWITGLLLGSLTIPKLGSTHNLIQEITSASRYINDYLLNEVLALESPETRDFLIKTSILNQMCAPLCNAVIDSDRSQQILEELEAANIFLVPLDTKQNWYRYHHLFQEFLFHKLHSEFPDEEKRLNLLASQWFISNQFYESAIPHLLSAKSFSQAANLIEAISERIQSEGKFDTLSLWLDALPQQEILNHPNLVIQYSFINFHEKNFSKVNKIINLVDRQLMKTILNQNDFNTFFGKLALIRGYLGIKKLDINEVQQAINEAESLISSDDLKWRSNLFLLKGWVYERRDETDLMEEAYRSACILCNDYDYATMDSVSASTFLANHLYANGSIKKAINTCQDVMQRTIIDERLISLLGINKIIAGAAFYQIGQLDISESHLKSGLNLLNQGEDVLWHLDCMYYQAMVQISKGLADNVHSILARMQLYLENTDHKVLLSNHIRGLESRLNLYIGERQKIIDWVAGYNPEFQISPSYRYYDFNVPFVYTIGFDRITLARFLISEGEETKALNYLELWMPEFRNSKRITELVEALLLLSICLLNQNQIDRAISKFIEAVLMSLENNLLQLFRGEYSKVELIINRIEIHHFKDQQINELEKIIQIVDFIEEVLGKTTVLRDKLLRAFRLLTPREIEIITLISQGVSNADIAKRLYISIDTLRSHIKNINQKLGSKNRTHAIFRAKEMGIIR